MSLVFRLHFIFPGRFRHHWYYMQHEAYSIILYLRLQGNTSYGIGFIMPLTKDCSSCHLSQKNLSQKEHPKNDNRKKTNGSNTELILNGWLDTRNAPLPENEPANEKEVLNAWCRWYQEAFDSVAALVDHPSAALLAAIGSAKSEMAQKTAGCLAYAEQLLTPSQP